MEKLPQELIQKIRNNLCINQKLYLVPLRLDKWDIYLGGGIYQILEVGSEDKEVDTQKLVEYLKKEYKLKPLESLVIASGNRNLELTKIIFNVWNLEPTEKILSMFKSNNFTLGLKEYYPDDSLYSILPYRILCDKEYYLLEENYSEENRFGEGIDYPLSSPYTEWFPDVPPKFHKYISKNFLPILEINNGIYDSLYGYLESMLEFIREEPEYNIEESYMLCDTLLLYGNQCPELITHVVFLLENFFVDEVDSKLVILDIMCRLGRSTDKLGLANNLVLDTFISECSRIHASWINKCKEIIYAIKDKNIDKLLELYPSPDWKTEEEKEDYILYYEIMEKYGYIQERREKTTKNRDPQFNYSNYPDHNPSVLLDRIKRGIKVRNFQSGFYETCLYYLREENYNVNQIVEYYAVDEDRIEWISEASLDQADLNQGENNIGTTQNQEDSQDYEQIMCYVRDSGVHFLPMDIRAIYKVHNPKFKLRSISALETLELGITIWEERYKIIEWFFNLILNEKIPVKLDKITEKCKWSEDNEYIIIPDIMANTLDEKYPIKVKKYGLYISWYNLMEELNLIKSK